VGGGPARDREQPPTEPVTERSSLQAGARRLAERSSLYDERDPAVGRRFLNDVGAAFDTVTHAPDRWPPVQGLPPTRRMHYYVMSNFPYTVVYRRRGEDTVEIVAVAQHKRDSRYWAPRSR
jgi:plasmid stabilization system protein ParE